MASRKRFVWRVDTQGQDTFKVVAESYLPHGMNLGVLGVGTPLFEQGTHDVGLLLARENLAQLFAVQPCAGGAFGVHVGEQFVQFGCARRA